MAGAAAEKENVDLADLAVQPAPLEDGAKRLKVRRSQACVSGHLRSARRGTEPARHSVAGAAASSALFHCLLAHYLSFCV